jgi:ribonucleotide monophosphatase NagD (HAD superfamily)
LEALTVAHACLQDPKQPIEYYTANPDFDYATPYGIPRMTMGAFELCLRTAFERSTGRVMRLERYGKPYPAVYEYVHRQMPQLNHGQDVKRIYMVGDNPISDIRGANENGARAWLLLSVPGLSPQSAQAGIPSLFALVASKEKETQRTIPRSTLPTTLARRWTTFSRASPL